MDTGSPAVTDPAAGEQGSYLWRAQALLANRAELFVPGPRPSKRTRALAAVREDRGPLRDRATARQLSLPLRERRRRRARMLS